MSTPMAEPEPFVLHINPSAAPQLMHSAHQLAASEQFVLQIGQSTAALPAELIEPSDSAPPPQQPPPHHATSILNLKVVEPILLHINSLSPLLSQINNHHPSSPQTQPSPSAPPPPLPPPPPPPPPPLADAEPPESIPIINNKIKNTHQKLLSTTGSLANLLPTGTVLAFQALTPSLSYNGRCHEFNKYLVAFVILVCSVICFMSSFTDSLKGKSNKVYYGIATSKGLLVFNNDKDDGDIEEMKELKEQLEDMKVKNTDFLHAFLSVFVFFIFAFSSSEVQGCYFPESRELEYSLVTYLPLVADCLKFIVHHFSH